MRPSDLSDARVIREGPTTADVYIDISPFYEMAPAAVSGYRSGGRRYAYNGTFSTFSSLDSPTCPLSALSKRECTPPIGFLRELEVVVWG